MCSKKFLPFQLKLANQISYIEKFLCLFKLKLTNQISYVSVGAEKGSDVVYDTGTFFVTEQMFRLDSL